MTPTTLRILTLVLAGVAYAASGYLAGSGHDGLIAVAAALLGWTVPMPASASKRPSVPPVALVFAVLLAGCGGGVYNQINDARNATATRLNEAQPLVVALCNVDPGPRCDDARNAYEVATASVAALDDALEVYRLTGSGIDEVGKAIRRAAESAREVANVVAR